MAEWDPFREVKKVKDQINRGVSNLVGGYKKPYSNITQNPRWVVINIELPDIRKRNIILEVNDERLVVRAENSSRMVEKGKNSYYEADRSYGYHRTITLPKGLAVDKTEAKFIGKVLKIRIPKRKTSKKVSIK